MSKWEPTEEQVAALCDVLYSIWIAEHERQTRAALVAVIGPEVDALRAEVARLREQRNAAVGEAELMAVIDELEDENWASAAATVRAAAATIHRLREQSGIAADSAVVEAVKAWQAQDRQQQAAIDITIDGKWRRRCGLPDDGVPAVVVAAVRALEALATATLRPCAEVAAEAKPQCCPGVTTGQACVACAHYDRARCGHLAGPAQPPAPAHYFCSRCKRPLGIDRARCNSDPDGEPICTRCLFTDEPPAPDRCREALAKLVKAHRLRLDGKDLYWSTPDYTVTMPLWRAALAALEDGT